MGSFGTDAGARYEGDVDRSTEAWCPETRRGTGADARSVHRCLIGTA